jgi:HD-like signal output (HDOD) protein
VQREQLAQGTDRFIQAMNAQTTPSEAPIVDAESADAAEVETSATLEFLLRRMRHKSDFPALSDSVGRIQAISASENESLGSLANEILKDVALTNKLLRVVNTAHYRAAGGGTISTVSRAIALIGFAGIRNIALSLMLVERMQDKQHAQQLKEEFLRALMAGMLASELCPAARENEEAFIGSLLRNLGRLLTEFYLPDEATQIRKLVRPSRATSSALADKPTPEAAASNGVLGISYENLGVGVGKTWGLPDTLMRCMRAPTGELPKQSLSQHPDRLRWLATVANEAADALLFNTPDVAADALRALAQRYGTALSFKAEDILEAASRSRKRMAELTQGMQLKLNPGEPAERLIDSYYIDAPNAAPNEEATGFAALDEVATHEEPTTPANDPATVLTAGIQDITNALVENFKLNEVLRMVLETIYRSLGFRRVVFCMRDAKSGNLVGRIGLGDRGNELAPNFVVPLKAPAGGALDLFGMLCLKGVDIMIEDASVATIASRLPAWFTSKVQAPTFLLLPLVMKGNGPQKETVIGFIYADKAKVGEISLSEHELSLLRTLRSQAVMAFKQAS